jgi:hypothetical protein
MSKNYIGGHSKVSTAMKGTSWGTYDPAESKPSNDIKQKAATKPSTKPKIKEKPRAVAKELIRQKMLRRQASCRINFIEAVRETVLSGGTPPPPFKRLPWKVRKAILKAPSVRKWAEAQPEYNNLNRAVIADLEANFEIELNAAEAKSAPLIAELMTKRKALKVLSLSKDNIYASDLRRSITKLEKELDAVKSRRESLSSVLERARKKL